MVKLNCEQLRERMETRGCEIPKEPCDETCPPCPDCPPKPCPLATPCPPQCPPVVVEKIQVVEVPEVPHGNWFVGAGPIYSAGWGAQAAFGYKWASGWALEIGPNYIDRDDINGSVVSCKAYETDYDTGNSVCRYSRSVPYHVEARSPWGGSAMLTYHFK
jgi:hypothetical protein